MDAAVLAVRVWPALLDRLDQPGGAVGDDQHRCLESAGDQVTPELKPVLVRLAHPQADRNERAVAFLGESPGAEHALLGALRADREVDRVTEERHQLELVEIAAPKSLKALAQL